MRFTSLSTSTTIPSVKTTADRCNNNNIIILYVSQYLTRGRKQKYLLAIVVIIIITLAGYKSRHIRVYIYNAYTNTILYYMCRKTHGGLNHENIIPTVNRVWPAYAKRQGRRIYGIDVTIYNNVYIGVRLVHFEKYAEGHRSNDQKSDRIMMKSVLRKSLTRRYISKVYSNILSYKMRRIWVKINRA